jgi:DNA-binding response OmpR family regulator
MCAMIMVVDDDKHTRKLLHFILTNAGYEVIEAEDGLDALMQLETTRPQLVILDVLMPNLDGFSTIHRIRNNPELDGLPVLFLSSRADVAAEYSGLEAGAQEYMVKPFSVTILLQHIRNLLSDGQFTR